MKVAVLIWVSRKLASVTIVDFWVTFERVDFEIFRFVGCVPVRVSSSPSAGEVLAAGESGMTTVVVTVRPFPFVLDWGLFPFTFGFLGAFCFLS